MEFVVRWVFDELTTVVLTRVTDINGSLYVVRAWKWLKSEPTIGFYA